MSRIARAYDALIAAAAVIGYLLVAAIFVLVIVDVGLRSTGFRPPAATSAVTEYAMLYMTMLVAPALVRSHGHVTVDSLVGQLAEGPRRALRHGVLIACIAVCLVLAWYSGSVTLDAMLRGEVDVRSIEIPRWVLVGILPVGFALCAVEFGRLLLGRRVA